MKFYTVIPLLGFLAFSGCSKKIDENVDAKSEEVGLSEGRVYPNTEYCIIDLGANSGVGSIGMISEEALSIGGKRWFSFSRSSKEGGYTLTVTFLGHKDNKDFYEIGIKAPGNVSKVLETQYTGVELELFKDGKYVMLLRPKKDQ